MISAHYVRMNSPIPKALLLARPLLLPLAGKWAKAQETRILTSGSPLPEQNLADARSAGVNFPEKIRLLAVDEIPLPDNLILRLASHSMRLITKDTDGLTLRYGIFITKDCLNDRKLIAHECIHTAQYERLGGFTQFLDRYLTECIEIGYPEAPMEQEAVLGAKRIVGG
jgi:hypothetical protein